MWSVPELNEEYIARMEDVLETYEKPYNPKEPVVCLDEKSVTLHADLRPPSAAAPGRSAAEFAPVACHLIQKYPDVTTIHLVVDNLNIHRRKSLTAYYGETAGNWM